MRDHIVQLVKQQLEALDGKLWRPRMIAVAIVVEHETPEIKGSEHHAFWHYCAYETCRDITTEVIGRVTDPVKAMEDADAPRLPGFQHLQTHYNVRRNVDGGKLAAREIVGVPIDQLTDDEMLSISGRMKAMGEALYAHADELDRYRALRGGAADAA